MEPKKALIKVTGKQNYGNDDDKIELTTIGTLEETDNEYILSYNEELEPNSAPIKTRLSVRKDEKRVELMRSGGFGSLLIIERSRRNLCTYATEFGDLLMGIYGKNIENEIWFASLKTFCVVFNKLVDFFLRSVLFKKESAAAA